MKFRDRLRNILSIKDSPHRLAMAFSIGIFIGMSPLLGLHTILGIAAAWIFRLNRIVTITGVFITNPWTIVPIYTFSAYIGARCLGLKQVIPQINWQHITFSSFAHELNPLLKPFVFGTLLMGFISAVISYFIIYYAIKKARSYGK
ncbi:MAG: hypothetical protein COZ31_12235 [Nitrospirae bacterium CG_4_10_14_3_um_filter_44_29]|nr:DUF2062 domain-containing protein [Nitrospirota bacterium]OIO29354.1 MAG: hypothetical protein AUJ60_05145 [Nitrospirae bacterium CG1_02_44_142]PIP70662.1 MAG: hypothetical protein COW90_04115 [Nitrospirae bacterium CG22_combo_CG10-13_8_21_14_all_44_11]PIV41551.1 MAG: hypothetical protein COS28_04950 [Nitrospirae bacterium CG02_land_8_20_14_3_00_44_33]PIV66310.1 MAG: hypothetical protein COS10_06850 [Nitrospirae bacterium CG01_land_8_20_14_3_00_44_22]PIW89533.1 MAG: hypothetical protein COZ